MADSATPHDNDVLFGRGFTISAHAGNRYLRCIVQDKKQAFLTAKKKEKRQIARRIVDEIKKLDPPGRFLIEDPNSSSAGSDDNEGIRDKAWLLVETEKAVDKVMHRLRERDKPLVDGSNKQQHEQQHSSISSFSTMPFGTALPSDDLTRMLQNMHSSRGGNEFLSMAISQAQQQNGMNTAQSSGMNVGQPIQHKTNVADSFQNNVNNLQYTSQPIQQSNMQHNSFQDSDVHQHEMQQYCTQPNVQNTSIGSPSTGMFVFSGTTVSQPINQINHQQGSMQLNASQADVGNILFGSQPTAPPVLSGSNMVQPIHLSAFGSQYRGSQSQKFQSSSLHPSSVESIGSSGIQPNHEQLDERQSSFVLAADAPGRQSNHEQSNSISLTTSPLRQEAFLNELARSSNDLVANAESTMEALTVGRTTDFDDLRSNHNKHPVKSQQQFQLVTLREWIDRSMPRFANSTETPGHLTEEMSSYIKSAIPLALKITEFLIEMETRTDSVSTASITCENILVKSEQNQENKVEFVDQVIIKNCVDDLEPGTNMPHLFSLGVVLYELFSSQSGKVLRNSIAESLVSVRSLSLSNDATVCNRPVKRSQLNLSRSGNIIVHDEFISQLEAFGTPQSLCALVGNLLDCIQGDLQSDDAYRSFTDVHTDLRLMRDDPSRFLDNLPVGQVSFQIGSKFYGRKKDISCIEQSYQRYISGVCRGIILSGGAGVGKSSLVSVTAKKLASQTNADFVEAKFDQNECACPLFTIGTAFNQLCDTFAENATQSQQEVVAATLQSALGNQAALLVGVLPSLSKLITCSANEASKECIDLAASMQFLFMKLLEILSEHRRVLFFLDDLQFADRASLLLISRLLSNTKESSHVFFACCYRDDDIHKGGPFALWRSSINTFPLEEMELKNINIDGVNELVSETLHLSPRITQPLASVLHHKTRGNPLFLRQLLDLLRDQSYIRLKLSPRRWAWNVDEIMSLKISDNVVALLIKEMQRLHADFQLGLNVAACLGSCVKHSIFDILSQDLNLNLRDVLDQAVQKGYMVPVDETKIRFVHDKVEQAAYEMSPAHQRLQNHMRFGLALTSHSLDMGVENDELFFIAVHQINRGGPSVLPDSKQRDMVAALNLKAGKRSIELSDFSTAFSLFQHGISFLDKDKCWKSQYALSLGLFDAAVEMACALNGGEAVRRLSEQLLANTRCDDDKLNCLYAVVKSLRLAYKLQDSKRVAITMLEQLEERLPRPMGDIGLETDILNVKRILQGMSDESILNMKETSQKPKDILTLNLYHDLNFLFQFIDTKKIADTSLRMAQITLSNGLCCMSPLAYAQFAIVLVTMGDTGLGYRLGTLGLRLLDKINAQRYTSAVIALVGTLVSWVSEPLQSITESHLLGSKYGERNGDVASGSLNYQFYLQLSYLSGQNLSIVREKSREFAHKLLQRKQKFMFNGTCSIHLQAVAFIEGSEFSKEGNGTDTLSSWDDMAKSRAGSHADFPLIFSSHLYARSFLFKQYDEMPREGLLDRISEKNVPLRPLFCCGIFFEGLVSFQLARQTDGEEFRRKGEAALTFMKNWSKRIEWNFENKYLLLEAEMKNLSGFYDQASQLYEDSIRSSNEHKFIHEEALGSELAATFFYEQGLEQKSHYFFMHSVDCYKKWGALAIAKRVEHDILDKFGPGFMQLESIDDPLAYIITSRGSSKKR